MYLQWTDGTPLFCRRCQDEVPHHHWRDAYSLTEGLRGTCGHVQSAFNPMLSLSVEQEVSPAVMLLPRRSWTEPYVQVRYALLSKYKNLNKGS